MLPAVGPPGLGEARGTPSGQEKKQGGTLGRGLMCSQSQVLLARGEGKNVCKEWGGQGRGVWVLPPPLHKGHPNFASPPVNFSLPLRVGKDQGEGRDTRGPLAPKGCCRSGGGRGLISLPPRPPST